MEHVERQPRSRLQPERISADLAPPKKVSGQEANGAYRVANGVVDERGRPAAGVASAQNRGNGPAGGKPGNPAPRLQQGGSARPASDGPADHVAANGYALPNGAVPGQRAVPPAAGGSRGRDSGRAFGAHPNGGDAAAGDGVDVAGTKVPRDARRRGGRGRGSGSAAAAAGDGADGAGGADGPSGATGGAPTDNGANADRPDKGGRQRGGRRLRAGEGEARAAFVPGGADKPNAGYASQAGDTAEPGDQEQGGARGSRGGRGRRGARGGQNGSGGANGGEPGAVGDVQPQQALQLPTGGEQALDRSRPKPPRQQRAPREPQQQQQQHGADEVGGGQLGGGRDQAQRPARGNGDRGARPEAQPQRARGPREPRQGAQEAQQGAPKAGPEGTEAGPAGRGRGGKRRVGGSAEIGPGEGSAAVEGAPAQAAGDADAAAGGRRQRPPRPPRQQPPQQQQRAQQQQQGTELQQQPAYYQQQQQPAPAVQEQGFQQHRLFTQDGQPLLQAPLPQQHLFQPPQQQQQQHFAPPPPPPVVDYTAQQLFGQPPPPPPQQQQYQQPPLYPPYPQHHSYHVPPPPQQQQQPAAGFLSGGLRLPTTGPLAVGAGSYFTPGLYDQVPPPPAFGGAPAPPAHSQQQQQFQNQQQYALYEQQQQQAAQQHLLMLQHQQQLAAAAAPPPVQQAAPLAPAPEPTAKPAVAKAEPEPEPEPPAQAAEPVKNEWAERLAQQALARMHAAKSSLIKGGSGGYSSGPDSFASAGSDERGRPAPQVRTSPQPYSNGNGSSPAAANGASAAGGYATSAAPPPPGDSDGWRGYSGDAAPGDAGWRSSLAPTGAADAADAWRARNGGVADPAPPAPAGVYVPPRRDESPPQYSNGYNGSAPGRPRLNLQPRSKPLPEPAAAAAAPPAANGNTAAVAVPAAPAAAAAAPAPTGGAAAAPRTSSIFGAARPREDVLRERGVPDLAADGASGGGHHAPRGGHRAGSVASGASDEDQWQTVGKGGRSKPVAAGGDVGDALLDAAADPFFGGHRGHGVAIVGRSIPGGRGYGGGSFGKGSFGSGGEYMSAYGASRGHASNDDDGPIFKRALPTRNDLF